MNYLLDVDYFLFRLINQTWTNSWFDSFFPWITDLHKTLWFQILILPIIGLVFFSKFRLKGLLLLLALLVCLSFTDFFGSQVVKDNFQRPRPGDTEQLHTIVRSPYGGYSFVSNHSANMFAFAVFCSAFFPAARAALFTLAFTVSYSRVYNGVHFPTDVLAGALLGILWGFIFSSGAQRWLKLSVSKKKVKT